MLALAINHHCHFTSNPNYASSNSTSQAQTSRLYNYQLVFEPSTANPPDTYHDIPHHKTQSTLWVILLDLVTNVIWFDIPLAVATDEIV